jgi:arylsulfatase A-like enzyme
VTIFGFFRRSAIWAVGTTLCCLGVLAGCGGGATEKRLADLEGQPVVLDFSKRLPAAKVFRESTFVDLGTPAGSHSLLTGWGNAETKPDGTTYVWAVAQRSELDLLVADTSASRVRFRAWPFTWDGAPDQIVTVSVNGSTIGSTHLEPGPHDYSLRVPRGALLAGVNRLAFDFAFAEEAGSHREGSTDHRTLAAAFDFVGVGEKFDPARTGDRVFRAPAARGDSLELTPGTGVVFRLNRTRETTLSFSLEVVGAPPPDSARVVVWSQRAGAAPVELLAADVDRVVGRRHILRVGGGAGRLEIGFAVSGGENTGVDGDWILVVSEPHLHAENRAGVELSNVLMVVVDTLRADRLGVYGSSLSTPNIDRLAARGVTFRQAYSHIPITGPSHSSIFTSLIPTEHGVHNNGQVLGNDIPVMTEVLRDEGRNTAAVVSLGVLQGRFGLSRGFDSYLDEFRLDWWKDAGEVNAEVFDILDGGLPEPFFLWVHYSDPHEPYTPPDIEYPRVTLELDGESVGELVAGGRAQEFDLELLPGDNRLRFVDVEAPGQRTYKLTTHTVDDPEIGFRPAAGWRSRERALTSSLYMATFPATVVLRNPGGESRRVVLELACNQELPRPEQKHRYDLEVEYVDREIGRLLDFMDQRHLLDNTLVVLLSDHGEGLGDHDHFGHISQLYNSLLHVAFIVAYPGHLPEGLMIDEPVGLVDVMPTVLDLMGLRSPDHINGANLLPLMRGEGAPPRSIVAETYRPEAFKEKRALVQDGFKYIHSWLDNREWEELYDLTADPGEIRDLSKIEVDRLAAMRAALQARLLEAVAADVVEAELSSEDIARLRALGYIR